MSAHCGQVSSFRQYPLLSGSVSSASTWSLGVNDHCRPGLLDPYRKAMSTRRADREERVGKRDSWKVTQQGERPAAVSSPPQASNLWLFWFSFLQAGSYPPGGGGSGEGCCLINKGVWLRVGP